MWLLAGEREHARKVEKKKKKSPRRKTKGSWFGISKRDRLLWRSVRFTGTTLEGTRTTGDVDVYDVTMYRDTAVVVLAVRICQSYISQPQRRDKYGYKSKRQ